MNGYSEVRGVILPDQAARERLEDLRATNKQRLAAVDRERSRIKKERKELERKPPRPHVPRSQQPKAERKRRKR